jgi:hypothetical protein
MCVSLPSIWPTAWLLCWLHCPNSCLLHIRIIISDGDTAQLILRLFYGLKKPRNLGFDSWHSQHFAFPPVHTLAVWPTQPPTNWVMGTVSLEVKLP